MCVKSKPYQDAGAVGVEELGADGRRGVALVGAGHDVAVGAEELEHDVGRGLLVHLELEVVVSLHGELGSAVVHDGDGAHNLLGGEALGVAALVLDLVRAHGRVVDRGGAGDGDLERIGVDGGDTE
jgi:hypothetical protein